MDNKQEVKFTLVELAKQRERTFTNVDIARWLQNEIDECKRRSLEVKKFKFRKQQQTLDGRHQCLIDMAANFLKLPI